MSHTRLSKRQEALIEFVASSIQPIHIKDEYLDNLISNQEGTQCVLDTIEAVQALIKAYEKIRLVSIWAKDQNQLDTLSTKLHVYKYVTHHLKAALDRLNPSIHSIYFYLLNSERLDKHKYAYLRTINKRKNGDVLLCLTKDFAQMRHHAMKSLFGEDASYFETDLLDSYPATKLSAADVLALLDSFQPKYIPEKKKLSSQR